MNHATAIPAQASTPNGNAINGARTNSEAFTGIGSALGSLPVPANRRGRPLTCTEITISGGVPCSIPTTKRLVTVSVFSVT